MLVEAFSVWKKLSKDSSHSSSVRFTAGADTALKAERVFCEEYSMEYYCLPSSRSTMARLSSPSASETLSNTEVVSSFRYTLCTARLENIEGFFV